MIRCTLSHSLWGISGDPETIAPSGTEAGDAGLGSDGNADLRS